MHRLALSLATLVAAVAFGEFILFDMVWRSHVASGDAALEWFAWTGLLVAAAGAWGVSCCRTVFRALRAGSIRRAAAFDETFGAEAEAEGNLCPA